MIDVHWLILLMFSTIILGIGILLGIEFMFSRALEWKSIANQYGEICERYKNAVRMYEAAYDEAIAKTRELSAQVARMTEKHELSDNTPED